jgi:aspartyl-tRNA(Asn)/glutamyl-tRNA(Gln) amidotransferase subunit A
VARAKFSAGAAVSPGSLEKSLERQKHLREEFSTLMRRCDALITLSSLELPCSVDDPDAVQRTYMRHARMPFNVTGTPALSVPTGFSDDGLPLGMQIAGKANDEAMVYRVAYAYEQATRWAERFHPSL